MIVKRREFSKWKTNIGKLFYTLFDIVSDFEKFMGFFGKFRKFRDFFKKKFVTQKNISL